MNIPRSLMVSFLSFIASIILFSFQFEPPVRNIVLGVGAGAILGASLFGFAYGIASMASVSMQRKIARSLMASSPAIFGSHPTRNVPPGDPHVVIYAGSIDDVIRESTRRTDKEKN